MSPETLGPGSRLEFWPDYGGALLWSGGAQVSLATLPLSPELVAAVGQWLAEYDDAKLPWEPTRDETWLAAGRGVFDALRDALWAHGIELVAGETHWRP